MAPIAYERDVNEGDDPPSRGAGSIDIDHEDRKITVGVAPDLEAAELLGVVP